MLLFPFAIYRLYELYQRKDLNLQCFAQELSLISLFFLLSLPELLWLPVSYFLFLRWYGFYKYQTDILCFIRNPRCFADSLKATAVMKPLIMGIFLALVSYYFLTPQSSLWIILLIPSLLFSFPPKKKTFLPSLVFSHEISTPVSPKYPALRKTHSFLGEKRIDITVKKPNIIFIFLESFRAKNVGCLGAKIPASPNFDKWARHGILFRNFHANGLQTFRAMISAYFGIPAHLRTVSLKPFCNLSMVGLPQILKKHGYHPAVIQSGDVSFDHLYPFFKKHGFETIIGGEDIPGTRTSSWGIDDEAMVKFATEWLEKQKEPTFLSLFTITNHHPWKSPRDHFSKDPYENFLKTFAYTDHCLNLFLEKVDLENSVIFIAGDHGQEMGERRPYSEMNHSLYEENIHLPMLMLGGNMKPQVIDANASFIDFLPTVLDMLNLKETHHSLGKSLLRKIESPTYFSTHREELQVGAILGRKKVILNKSFDLTNDPEERVDLGPSNLSQQCKSFFQDVDAIMQNNAWAPPHNLYSLKATNEKELIAQIKKHPYIPVIDFSSGHLGDQAISLIPPKNAACWHQVTFRNCTRITDTTLHWMRKHCQSLMSLDLSYCLLLTDDGVRNIISPTLRHLWLDGLDLEDFAPENITLNLQVCSLKDIPHLQNKTLMTLYKNSPHLIQWSATLTNVKNEDLLEMSRFKKQSTSMSLSDGIHIQDDAISHLLLSQEELQEVHLENFPLIENPDFSKLTKLRYVTITACPKLNRSSIEKLSLLRVSFYE